jgi:hypothetical protein
MGKDQFLDELRKIEAAKLEATDRAVAGLEVLAKAIRTNPTAGQTRRLVRFLAGVYNGPYFPFDLTDLRGLDLELATACLDVLALDHFGIREIHNWGPVSAEELNKWFLDEGLYYEVQKRRIAGELYDHKYPNGHPDEGMTG